jgi:hypothetical protein
MGKGCCVYQCFYKLFMMPAGTLGENDNICCNADRHNGGCFH